MIIDTHIVLPDEVGLVDAPSKDDATVIVRACIVCGENKPAAENRDGRCLDCRLGARLASNFERLATVMRKQRHIHDRLGRRGHQGVDDQVGRELKRIWKVISDEVPDRKRRHEYLNRTLKHVATVDSLTEGQLTAAMERAAG